MDIKPIETFYHGCRFRSRLEARWAVFFDALGVPWEYEPEGFDLGDGTYYLPDFRLKCYGKRGGYTIEKHEEYPWRCSDPTIIWPKPFDLYIEVKGRMTEEDAAKIIKFAGYKEREIGTMTECSVERPILIVGNIPSFMKSHDSWAVGAYDKMDGCDIYPFNYQLIDCDYFAAYPAARDGKFYLWGDDSNYINKEDIDAVERAYDAARQARFEHGETPVIFK